MSISGIDQAQDRLSTRGLVLLARSAFAAAPYREMRALCDLVSARIEDVPVSFAFSEQGTPSLREELAKLAFEGVEAVTVVPLILPMEPAFGLWLRRSLSRWQAEEPSSVPTVMLAGEAIAQGELLSLIAAIAAGAEAVTPCGPPRQREGSIVPAQERRVLVCHGGPCTQAGAPGIWVHLRNEQERLGLRALDPGTMTTKSTCLGPCNLAPAVQVFPEATYYGGVDVTVLDEIIGEHLIKGRIAARHAYPSNRRKQRLR